MAYDIVEPLVTVYAGIEDLGHLSHAAQKSYYMSQLVNYGFTIIENTDEFEARICTWIMRPIVEHMWSIFKTYFEEAHWVLRVV